MRYTVTKETSRYENGSKRVDWSVESDSGVMYVNGNGWLTDTFAIASGMCTKEIYHVHISSPCDGAIRFLIESDKYIGAIALIRAVSHVPLEIAKRVADWIKAN